MPSFTCWFYIFPDEKLGNEFNRTILCLCAFVFAFLINSLPRHVYGLRDFGEVETKIGEARPKQEGLFASFIKDELIRKFDNKIGSYGKGNERKHLQRERKILIRESAAIKGGKEDYEGTERNEE